MNLSICTFSNVFLMWYKSIKLGLLDKVIAIKGLVRAYYWSCSTRYQPSLEAIIRGIILIIEQLLYAIYYTQNYQFCRLQLLVEAFGHSTK